MFTTSPRMYRSSTKGYFVGHELRTYDEERLTVETVVETPYYETVAEAKQALDLLAKRLPVPNRTVEQAKATFRRHSLERLNSLPNLTDEELPF